MTPFLGLATLVAQEGELMLLKLLFSAFLLLTPTLWALTSSSPALEPRWDSVIHIKTEARDPLGSEAPSYCNATLLSARMLITAAHCLSHAEVLKSRFIEVEVGAYKYTTRPDGQAVRIGYVKKIRQSFRAQFFFTPELLRSLNSSGLKTKISPAYDIAIAVLDSPVPVDAQFPFAEVISTRELNSIKSRLLQYRPTVVTVNYLTEMSTDTRRLANLNSIKWDTSRHYTSRSQSRVEEGDSGAPLFIQTATQWKLIGVVKGRAETIFSNWDVFGSVDTNLCAIAQLVPQEFKSLICKL